MAWWDGLTGGLQAQIVLVMLWIVLLPLQIRSARRRGRHMAEMDKMVQQLRRKTPRFPRLR